MLMYNCTFFGPTLHFITNNIPEEIRRDCSLRNQIYGNDCIIFFAFFFASISIYIGFVHLALQSDLHKNMHRVKLCQMNN